MSDANSVTMAEAFGGCPECGGSDGYRNVGRQQWALCTAHRTTWQIGENLFGSWREENPEVWVRNALLLNDYRVVEPLIPTAAPSAPGGN